MTVEAKHYSSAGEEIGAIALPEAAFGHARIPHMGRRRPRLRAEAA